MNAPAPTEPAPSAPARKPQRRQPRRRQHQQYKRTSAVIDERPDGKPIIFGYGRHMTKREKERVQRFIAYGALGVLIVVSVALVAGAAIYQNIIYPNQSVASVNGHDISRSDVQAVTGYFSALSSANGTQLQQDPTALAIAKLQKNVLARIEADRQLHITISDADIEARLKQDISGLGGDGAFGRLLSLTGLSRDDYKRLFANSEALEDRVGDYWTHWSSNDPHYKLAEQWDYARIQTKDAKGAQAVLTKLATGSNFAALARSVSIDAQTNTKGGDLGWQRPIDTQTDALLPTALPQLKAMEKSHTKYQLLHTGSQYYVITLLGHDLKHPISDLQHQQDRVTAFNTWFAPLQSSARFNPPLPADQQITQPTSGTAPVPATGGQPVPVKPQQPANTKPQAPSKKR